MNFLNELGPVARTAVILGITLAALGLAVLFFEVLPWRLPLE